MGTCKVVKNIFRKAKQINVASASWFGKDAKKLPEAKAPADSMKTMGNESFIT